MQFLRRKTAPPPTLPIHNGPSRVSSCLDWMATATSVIFTEQDEWKKQYKMVKYSASEHNKSLIEVLKERNGNDFDEISPFMNQHPSNRGEQETQRVEAFCEGADMILHGSDPTIIRGHKLANVEEPRAWVSDRNYWLLKDNPTETSRHGNVLGRIDLYNILQKERFRESTTGEMVGPIRQIFVSNPDGASVLAILKTANEFQVTALHDLLTSYITTDPSPSISLKVSDFWNTSYVLSFTLPFYAIGRRRKQDRRTLHDRKWFRARYDLDSLNLEELCSTLISTGESPLQESLVLHEGVYSFSATGVTEEHWTAYCFDDDFFESESRLLEDEEEIEISEGCIDPIIVEAELRDTATQWRPRQYSLVALATQLEKIYGHHECAHDVFKQSLASSTRSSRNGPSRNLNHSNEQDWKRFPDLLSKVIFYTMENVKEVENFLKNEVQLSQASVPQGVFWQSLRNDIKALKALRAITENLKKLKRLGDKMEETKKSFKELRRERKLDRADEQQNREERTKEFTIAAVVFAILSLIAQVYSGKPQKGDEASWPGYLFLVASFLIICIAGILYMLRNHLIWILDIWHALRKHIAHYGKVSALKVKMTLKTKSVDLRNSLRTFSLAKCAYYICFYSGLVFLFRILKKRLRRDETILPTYMEARRSFQ